MKELPLDIPLEQLETSAILKKFITCGELASSVPIPRQPRRGQQVNRYYLLSDLSHFGFV